MNRRAQMLCLLCLPFIFVRARGQTDNVNLVEILKARSQQVQTLDAKVRVVDSAGSGRKDLARDTLLFAKWLSRNKPNLPWGRKEKEAKQLQLPQGARVSFYRYLAQNPSMIRIEQFGEADSPATAFARKPELGIYSEEKWYQYTPPERIPKGRNFGELWVPQSGVPSIPQFDVASGRGVGLTAYFKGSNRALATRQVTWEEFLSKVSLDTVRQLVEPLSRGGPPLAVLEIGTVPPDPKSTVVPQPKTSLGSFRVRLWFDPALSYIPLRLEADHLRYNFVTNNFEYLHDQVVEWGEPIRLGNGITFCRKCKLYSFAHFMPPAETEVDGNRWPEKAYEFSAAEFQFSDIRINEPLDPAVFTITPPPNTNVVDEVSGYHYAIGSAGELIKKEALSWAQELPPPAPSTWKKALLGALLLGIAVAASLVTWCLLRPVKARKVP